ncbi:hypothetical protein Q4551_02780 [Oceanobacter sp. 5_MG-2023]|uniref:4-fold beta flower protein n=1 Tax=Oceanobacter sp. 5_MG-2023 TaxID=3062645 RepID=UPI0026E3B6F4|nr:hypothetical protein [Oceanobacter sp. 5_MG-2023]MDO6681202.1 hypothetical protein [Oceanobacter sp. 5_MG-2023]
MKKILLAILLLNASSVFAESEITLFAASGDASAYIALNEELTIYLWSGEPVAYLTEDSSGGYHVYGFNGKHLGWFVGGVVRDHKGDAACGKKEVMQSTKYEPYKSYKQYKPYKAYKEYAPYRPYFSNNFGQLPCNFLLASGSAN